MAIRVDTARDTDVPYKLVEQLEPPCDRSLFFDKDPHGPDGQHEVHEDFLLQFLHRGCLLIGVLAGPRRGIDHMISLHYFIFGSPYRVVGMIVTELGEIQDFGE
jgi:hypothetical protein